MYILALDASLSSTGFCVMNYDNREVVECGKITTKPKDIISDRLNIICSKCNELIEKYNIKMLAIEGQYVHKNKSTALKLASLLGAIMITFSIKNIEIYKIQPSQVRRILLHGDATKEEMAKLVQDYYSENSIVNTLGELNDRNCKAKNSDIYDAITIALSFIKGVLDNEVFQRI